MATFTFSTPQPQTDHGNSPTTLSLLEEFTGSRTSGRAMPANCGPTKAIAWARVSTADQEERGLSIPEQLREIRQYASSKHIEIVAEFTEAESAFQRRAKRPEF